ncbi:MAG: hypothetical protein WCT29_02700 [Candidatus Paceibacterota bacterium]|jgi:hypothetical protein
MNFVFLLFPIGAATVSIFLSANYLISTLLFFVPLAFILSFRRPENISSSLLFSAFAMVPILLPVDYYAFIYKVWYIPNTIFPFRLLSGSLPVDDIIWVLLYCYVTVMLYHTLALPKSPVRLRLRFFILPILSLAILLLLMVISLNLAYPYFYMCLFAIMFLGVALWKYKYLSKSMLIPASFMAFLLLLFEMTGNFLHHWDFPGKYLGFMGYVPYPFPLEEFLFIVILSAPCVVVLYEFSIEHKLP